MLRLACSHARRSCYGRSRARQLSLATRVFVASRLRAPSGRGWAGSHHPRLARVHSIAMPLAAAGHSSPQKLRRLGMWKLRPGWTVEQDGCDIIIQSDSKRFRIRSPEPLPNDFAHSLVTGCAAGHDESTVTTTGALVDELVKRDLVIRIHRGFEAIQPLSPQFEYFSHIGLDPDLAKLRLAEARVMVIGVGGTGSVVLQHLVAAGVTRFLLVDDDLVEASNLERQFIYAPPQIGTAKTTAAAAYLWARLPTAKVAVISQRIDTSDAMRQVITENAPVNLCVVCIDRPPETAFTITTSTLWQLGIPCIHGGVLIRSGFYGPLLDRARSTT